jgi:hypothetical protein
MTALLVAFLAAFRASVRSRFELSEILACGINPVPGVKHRGAYVSAPLIACFGCLARIRRWRRAVRIVTPDTVVRWHRRGFAFNWRWRSRPRRPGRPAVAADIRTLIRQMQMANPLWGAPRIHGELQKLGVTVSQTTVAKYLRRRNRPPSPTWRSFLRNHVSQLASIDFFTVPTATFRVLFVFVVLSHDRRRIVHVNITAHPTAAWTAQQIREAWPDTAALPPPGSRRDLQARSAAGRTGDGRRGGGRRPRHWQNPFVERLIGSSGANACHVIVWNERALRRHLQRPSRTTMTGARTWLAKDAPVPRPVQPPTGGSVVVQVRHLGGLHHHYERRAA